MGLTIDNFVTLPGVRNDSANEKVRLHASGELSKTSAFFFFRSHARARENNATAQAFLDSIGNHPAYSKYATVAADTLTALRQDGKPLTTRHINAVMTQLEDTMIRDLGQTIGRGQELARAGVIPDGFGRAFGQFCMLHPLGNIGETDPVPGAV
ncbi:MAG: hypothetical protein GX055_09750, partial [Desulfovibrionales bacterium]|nr:hypothetical protein [Desulfovibrionales bacterium]